MACLSVVLCDFVSCMKSIFKLEVNQEITISAINRLEFG